MNSENNALLLLKSLTKFGSHDVMRTADWLDEANVDYGQFANFVSEFCNDTGTPLTSLDLPAMALECIAERAGVSDLRGLIHTNFLCSCFDVGEDEAGELLYRIPEEQRNATWTFLRDFTQAIEPESDEPESDEPELKEQEQ